MMKKTKETDKQKIVVEDFTLRKNALSSEVLAELKGTSPPGVEKAVVMPNAKTSSGGGLPRGVVYWCKGSAPAYPIFGDEEDVCAGVSLYHIKKFPSKHLGGKEASALEAFSSWTKAERRPFHDYSLRASVTEEKVSIAGEGSAVSIMKTDGPDPKWFICVKTYSDARAKALSRAAATSTIAQVYESNEYKRALKAGATTRSAIAASVAESMGLDVGAVTGKTSPEDADIVTLAPVWAECLYNVIEKSAEKPDEYAFFKHCYALNTVYGGVPVFHRSHAAATFFNIEKSPETPFPAFPMTFPCERVSSPGHSHPGSVFWGGKLCYNEFLHDSTSVSHELGSNQREWSSRLEKLGFDYKAGFFRLESVASYVSTGRESEVSLDLVLGSAPPGVGVYLPVSHSSILDLLSNYHAVTEEDPALRLDDFLQHDHDAPGYFTIGTDPLKSLRDALDSLSTAKTNLQTNRTVGSTSVSSTKA